MLLGELIVVVYPNARFLPVNKGRQLSELQTSAWSTLNESLRQLPQCLHKKFLERTVLLLFQETCPDLNEADLTDVCYYQLAKVVTSTIEATNPDAVEAVKYAMVLATNYMKKRI